MGPFLLLPWPLWPSPRLRPRLILTTDTDTDLVDTTEVLVTLDTDSDMDTDSDTAMDYCTARGLLMLSPRLRPRLILTTDTDSAMVSITARGLLMLRPIPTFSTVDSDTPDTDTDSAMVSITASRLHQDLSVNQLGQKWIVISLNFPSPVLQFQCYHTKSLVMVSRKQENQSCKNPTNIKIT